MEETFETDVVLSLKMNGREVVNKHPWDSNMYEMLDSFIGACVSVGFPIEIINEILGEYTDNIKQQQEDAKTN